MASLLRTKSREVSFVELQARAADDQPWAVEALADEFRASLISFAEARGAADPEGIAHVSLLTVLRKLGDLHFEAREQMWAYLCRTARSRIIDEHRATKPVELVDDAGTLTTLGTARTPSATAHFDDRVVERDYVDGLLSPLTNDQRQVLELRFLDDLSIAETADRTGRSQEAVKGLQRRAINAIIAAAAVILALLAVRWAGIDDESKRTSNAPADSVPESPDDSSFVPQQQNENAPDRPAGGTGARAGDTGEQGSGVLDLNGSERVEGGTGTGDGNADGSDGSDELEPGQSATDSEAQSDPTPADAPVTANAGRYVVTVGSDRSTELDVSGERVAESFHGTRVYCTVSHVAHGNPIAGAAAPGTAPATLYWGNTSADVSTPGSTVARSGNSTCEGGTNDRSAYWMPALFDGSGQVVLPEAVLVEYKTFGPPGFDRAVINPIPAGLEMVIAPAVAESEGRLRNSGGGSGGTSFAMAFPECIAVNANGEPRLSSAGHTAHLSYAGAATASGCPATHPYRIPQITYKIDYGVAYSSSWSLSTGYDSGSDGAALSAGFVAGWDRLSMERMVRCTIELIDHCEFAGTRDGRPVSRTQLPQRFVGPDGSAVYVGSTTLDSAADRTPFGQSLPRLS